MLVQSGQGRKGGRKPTGLWKQEGNGGCMQRDKFRRFVIH